MATPFVMNPVLKALVEQIKANNHNTDEILNNPEYSYMMMALDNYKRTCNYEPLKINDWLIKEMKERGYKNIFVVGQQYGRITITKRTKCFLFFNEHCEDRDIPRKLKINTNKEGEESIDMCLFPNQTPIKLMAYEIRKNR
jgi:hypothetical protein